MSKIQKKLNLLPTKYKNVGYVGIGLAIIVFILSLTKMMEKEIASFIIKSILAISFLIIALSKDKIEDELIENIRLKAFAYSFVLATFIVFIFPIFDVVLGGEFKMMSGLDLLMYMFGYYFFNFYNMKSER